MSEAPGPDAPAPVQLQIDSRQQDEAAVLALSGELDIASAPDFERALADLDGSEATSRLVLDLSELTFMDSTGLRALLLARQRAVESDRELILRPGPRQVQRVFELSGTLDRFRFED